MALVKMMMKRNLVTVTQDAMVSDAVKEMNENRVGVVLLLDGEKLCGIFSERDLLRRVVGAGKDPGSTPIKEVATLELKTVRENTPIAECSKIIRDSGFRHLPIVDGKGAPVGIISSRDFLQYIVGGLESFIDNQKYQQNLDNGIDPYDHIGAGFKDE